MTIPKDKQLYETIKKKVYKQYETNSAYRSGQLVKQYKKAYEDKYGNKNAYEGKKKKSMLLSDWFKEDWKNQRGEVGYKYKSDIYRPTKRINKETPTTFNELSKKEIKEARKEKLSKGRVKKFKSKKI
jgi:hypothetical protein